VDTLTAIRARADAGRSPERGAWILRDLPAWLRDPSALRQVRNLARYLPTVPRAQSQALILITPSGEIPPELAGHATVIEWPLPDRSEVAAILDATIGALPAELREQAAPNGARDAAIDAAIGLTGEEAAACYCGALSPDRWDLACSRCGPIVSLCYECTSQERAEDWARAHAVACGGRVTLASPAVRITVRRYAGGTLTGRAF
jgi:hypothetical protein